MSDLHAYPSANIDVQYDVKRCIHAGECVQGAPKVFDPKRQPWVDPSQAEASATADVVMRCPSGALHFSRNDGGSEETPDAVNTIAIQPDGPLFVRGDIRIETQDGEVILTDTRVALCRCGLSKNKPFCDNSHIDNFSDAASLGTISATEPSGDSRVLTVVPSGNGPLLFRGPVSITAADGSTSTTQKCALCRCGHSSNKPFCDGTHREVGFVSAG